jgi:acetolactate synthase-1/3 small subunit
MAERVIELLVRNHPGVMSHVTGLFARRAFNIEHILCLPDAGRETSRILFSVDDGGRLEQILRQVEKLHDVLEARLRPEGARELFGQVASFLDVAHDAGTTDRARE